jgi:hypothetical protein
VLIFVKRSDRTVVRWNTEPIEYDFHFYNNDRQAMLDIAKLTDCRTNSLTNKLVFRINSSPMDYIDFTV